MGETRNVGTWMARTRETGTCESRGQSAGGAPRRSLQGLTPPLRVSRLSSKSMATPRITTGPAQGQSIECNHEVVMAREGADLLVDDYYAPRPPNAIRPGPRGVEVEDL